MQISLGVLCASFRAISAILAEYQDAEISACNLDSTINKKFLWEKVIYLIFTPQPLRAVGVLFSPKVSRWAVSWAGGRREKVCPGCISETVRCRKLILVGTLVRGCRCAMSWCDLDLTFDLAAVTLSLKILSGLYLRN